jgi:hypothetical protein
MALGGGPATPKGQRCLIFFFFFFLDLAIGGGFGHPIAVIWGGRSHPQPLIGVVQPPPTLNWGGSATFNGVANHLFFFFFK